MTPAKWVRKQATRVRTATITLWESERTLRQVRYAKDIAGRVREGAHWLWRKTTPPGGRDRLEVLALSLFIIVFVVVLWNLNVLRGDDAPWDLRWMLPRPAGDLSLEDFRNATLGLAGLGGALFGLYQLSNSATRSRLMRIDTDVRREAERNDRYVKAVELLKDPDDSVRMGGIYALERLAKEDDGAYFDTVIEVLSAYVRYRTNAQKQNEDGEWVYTYPPRVRGQREQPTEPVIAAMKCLSRLWQDIRQGTIDLEGAWLPKLRAQRLNMQRWQLHRTNLQGARLFEANLSGARLFRANLESAVLNRANLEDAKLWEASLDGTNLNGANLKRANFIGAIKITRKQLNEAVWPSSSPPRFLPRHIASDPPDAPWRDKSWCTDPRDPTKLLPEEKWGRRPILDEDE